MSYLCHPRPRPDVVYATHVDEMGIFLSLFIQDLCSASSRMGRNRVVSLAALPAPKTTSSFWVFWPQNELERLLP